MKKELMKCPMCEGSLEIKTDFNDPQRGLIKNINYQVCLNCGEMFFPPGVVDKINSLPQDKQSLSENETNQINTNL